MGLKNTIRLDARWKEPRLDGQLFNTFASQLRSVYTSSRIFVSRKTRSQLAVLCQRAALHVFTQNLIGKVCVGLFLFGIRYFQSPPLRRVSCVPSNQVSVEFEHHGIFVIVFPYKCATGGDGGKDHAETERSKSGSERAHRAPHREHFAPTRRCKQRFGITAKPNVSVCATHWHGITVRERRANDTSVYFKWHRKGGQRKW